ncbi:MAG TPA: DUF2911 domain-containing protein [Gemmatimonadales bacterium]|nr:DUF2911 domain-containing protein [Gemmatimonadales bacterium]
MSNARWLSIAIAGLAAVPATLHAQVRASEHAIVAQTVDGTTLTVEYSRPSSRGRVPVYGKVVTWGEVWTPGANWATTLEVDKDVSIDGHPLPKGKYSVWMEVQPAEWTVILDPKAKQFHTAHPKPDSAQIRFAVTPDSVSGPELLTWSFTEVSMTGTVLRMAWAGRAVALRVAVTPSHPLTFAPALAARYVGNYSLRWLPEDSAAAAPDSAPPLETWRVTYTPDTLRMDWEVPGDSDSPYHAVLISIGTDAFYPGFVEEYGIFDAQPGLATEFDVSDGRATGFVIRGKNDQVRAVGTRIP